MAKKEDKTSLLEGSIDRRDFIKKSSLITAPAPWEPPWSLFSPLGTPFIFAKTQDPIKVGFCEVLSGLFAGIGLGRAKGRPTGREAHQCRRRHNGASLEGDL